MKNKSSDLNNHLFAQLERLNDEDLPIEHLEFEVERAKAIASVAAQIISNGNLALKAKSILSCAGKEVNLPELLED